jgi:HPt (histidine-containing phosphotransfer) domain-containing protein
MSEFDERFAALRERFLVRTREDMAAIEKAAATQDPDRDALRRVVHRLAGAAGTFGFATLSRIAGEADDALVVEQPDIADELERLIAELRLVLDA